MEMRNLKGDGPIYPPNPHGGMWQPMGGPCPANGPGSMCGGGGGMNYAPNCHQPGFGPGCSGMGPPGVGNYMGGGGGGTSSNHGGLFYV